MRPFSYILPKNPQEAITASAANKTAKYLGGGTNLIDLMKEDVEHPTELIEVADLSFNEIEANGKGGYLLGATCTNAETANHPDIRKNYPLLSMAMLSAATVQIRNMATNGGNLLQRTRCPYFYEIAMPCNKRKPGSGCGARNGMNALHAIFGWNDHCVAVNPSDMCVALAALGAIVHVQQPDSKLRTIDFADFHRLPENQPEKDNTLQPNDLITAIELPEPVFSDHYYYLKIRERSSYAFALISVAAGLKIESGKITKAGLAMGGVAHKPWKLTEVEAFLQGKMPTEENFEEAGDLAMRDAHPLADNGFKVEMGKKAIARALSQAYEKRA